MSVFNLFRYIQHLTENHQDTQRYEIALWRKLLYPFAVFVIAGSCRCRSRICIRVPASWA